jgi:hypothetical protein
MDIASNLISEAIGIIVTVFLVDRLLEYRERRRWRGATTLVLRQLELSCGDLLMVWADWLAAVRKRGLVLQSIDDVVNTGSSEPELTQPMLPFKEYEDICRFCGGEVQVGDSDKVLIDVVIPENVHQQLRAQLACYALEGDDPAWRHLKRGLSRELEKLTSLLSRLPKGFPDMPDISTGTETIFMLVRKIDSRLYLRPVCDGMREDRNTSIAYVIGMTMSMRKFVRTMIQQ